MPSKGVLDPGRGPSFIRVTTPANLELALEGLVRKVLKEQPKQEDIYSFAADYFEHLVEIRDKAENPNLGFADICPGRSEAEASELIKLATSFAKPAFLATVLKTEPCTVVDVDQGFENVSGSLQKGGAVEERSSAELIQEDEAIASESLQDEQVTVTEQSQERKSDSEDRTDNAEAVSEEVPQNSDPNGGVDTESGKSTAEDGEGGQEPEADTQETIRPIADNTDGAVEQKDEDVAEDGGKDVAENAEDGKSDHVPVDEVTDIAEERKSENEDGGTVVPDERKAEEVAQDGGTAVSEEQKADDVALDGDTGVPEEQKVEEVDRDGGTAVPEEQKDEEVDQDGGTAVPDEKKDEEVAQVPVEETAEDAVKDVPDVAEEGKHEDVFLDEATDVIQEQTPPEIAENGDTSIAEAPKAESPAEEAVTEVVEDRKSAQEGAEDPQTDDAESTNVETLNDANETSIEVEKVLQDDVPAEQLSQSKLTVNNDSQDDETTEQPAVILPESSETADLPTEDSPSAGVPSDNPPESTPQDMQSELPTEQELVTEDNPSTEISPSAEDVPPETSQAEASPPTEPSTETVPLPEIPSDPSEAAEITTEPNPQTEIPAETSAEPEPTTEDTSLQLPADTPASEVLVEPTTEDNTQAQLPAGEEPIPHLSEESEHSKSVDPSLDLIAAETEGSEHPKSNDASLDLITAETEQTEVTKERDIIKEFLEREQEFSTMGNSTRSVELAEVHLEDPPSDLSLTAETTSGLVGGTVIENSVFDEEATQESVGGLIGGVSLLEKKEEGLIGGVAIPDVDAVISEEPITASLIGGVSHEHHDVESAESQVDQTPVTTEEMEPSELGLPEVVEQASAVVDDILQEAAGRQEGSIEDSLKPVEEKIPVSDHKTGEDEMLKDDSGSNHSRSSKESESLDEENPFISAEVKTLVQEQAPAVVETDSQEDEADVIIPLNADIGTIEESDEGKWDAQLTLVRAAIVIQKNFRKYLQRKNDGESFTRSEDVGKESTSTDSSLSSSATKIRQSSRTIESSRSDATNSFNETKLIKTKAKSMSTVPDSEVWDTLEQELEESGNTQQNSHRQKLRREDAVQITTTASEDSATESPKKQRLLGTGELHDLIVPEEN